jgi:GT2 family glycosyltransferase
VDYEFSRELESYCRDLFSTETIVSQIVYNKDFNFAQKCNLGMQNSNGEVIVFLNDDAEFISRDAIKQLSSMSLQNEVGAVGALLLFQDSSIQHSGIEMNSLRPVHFFADHFVGDLPNDLQGKSFEVSAVTGACLAVERKKLNEVGGWNESLPNSYNDVDLCMSLNRLGNQSVQMNGVSLKHFESATRDASFDSVSFGTLSSKFAAELLVEKYLFSNSCKDAVHSHGMNFELHNLYFGKPFAYLLHLVKTRGLATTVGHLLKRFKEKTKDKSQICNSII